MKRFLVLCALFLFACSLIYFAAYSLKHPLCTKDGNPFDCTDDEIGDINAHPAP